MLRKQCVLGLLFLGLTSCVAYASGDFGCGPPSGAIFFVSYQYCNSVPFLSPSNDSRLNLELLLIDAGRAAGSLNVPETTNYYGRMNDFSSLQVPFDFGNWQLSEPKSSSATDTDANTSAASPGYAEGEGSRCNTAASGLEALKNAVNTAAGLPKEDAATLLEIRSHLSADCSASTPVNFNPPQGLRSALAHDFVAYIAGANAFYAGDYASAAKEFEGLKNSANPWLKETSRYMVGRTLLNSAQSSAFGEWGELKLANVDKDSLRGAENAFNSYLQDYPSGLYAASARGLLRRVYWLVGDQTRLAEAFDRALMDSGKNPNNVSIDDLVEEADTKLLTSVQIDEIKSPLFLAIVDLMRMRRPCQPAGAATAEAPLKLAELEAQKSRFATNPALYKYLLAAFHIYVDNKPDEALALLPTMLQHAPLNYFAFSQQTLRIVALEAGKQYEKERQLVLEMWPLAKLPPVREQLQLVLARVDVLSGHSDRIFAPDSLVQDKAIRTIVVEYTASPEMLRERIKDPKESAEVVNAALYSLLYKELTGGKYAAFQSDLALVPSPPPELLAPFVASGEGKSVGYPCPSMREVAAALQRDANDGRSLNCVGELVRLHGVHYGQVAAPAPTDLGGTGSLFPVTNYSRLDGYMKVIANHEADRDVRAYALYRAVNCFASSGNNGCGPQDIPKSTRKQWFTALHREYPNTIWAKSSKYYW